MLEKTRYKYRNQFASIGARIDRKQPQTSPGHHHSQSIAATQMPIAIATQNQIVPKFMQDNDLHLVDDTVTGDGDSAKPTLHERGR
jgi:hypothetical protein